MMPRSPRFRSSSRPLAGLPSLLALAAALLLALALPALAAPDHGFGGEGEGYGAAEHGFAHAHPGRHLARLSRALDLTEAQKDEVREIFEDAQEQVEPLREAQAERHEALRALLDGDSPDATEVGELVIAAHADREQVKAIHEAAFESFKSILTADQLAKLEELQENRGERPAHRRGGRRGAGNG